LRLGAAASIATRIATERLCWSHRQPLLFVGFKALAPITAANGEPESPVHRGAYLLPMTIYDTYADRLPNPLLDEKTLRHDFARAEAIITEHSGTDHAVRMSVVRDRIAQARRMLTPGLNGPLA
jgi:hypothetical protein